MTTYFDFNPSDTEAFQFQPSLDGNTYTVIVTWNIFGQRYYVNIYDSNNVLIVSLPMISSPPGYDISLTKGYFSSTMVFRGIDNRFEVSP